MTNVRKNSAKLTREDLKIASESPTMKLSETPAVEPSDQTSKTVRHAPLVYRVEEIAQLLAISNRAAYNLCNTTKDFKVIRLGTSIRVSKQSFDDWFAGSEGGNIYGIYSQARRFLLRSFQIQRPCWPDL